MPLNDSITRVIPLTPGTQGQVGRRFAVHCTIAGNVEIMLSNGQLYVVPVAVGYQTFPFSVLRVSAGGNTTATATYFNQM